jgi:hypothetical protein
MKARQLQLFVSFLSLIAGTGLLLGVSHVPAIIVFPIIALESITYAYWSIHMGKEKDNIKRTEEW